MPCLAIFIILDDGGWLGGNTMLSGVVVGRVLCIIGWLMRVSEGEYVL